MPIDLDKVVGASLPEVTGSWDEDDVILYHLGVGAGDPPTSPNELSYCYEAALRVLPSFATIPPFAAMLNIGALDGMDVNPALILHGEQEIELHRSLPVSATARSESRVSGVYDKSKAALVVLQTVTADGKGPLFTNRASLFVRGEGGFGGDPGPPSPVGPPERDPDLVVECRTLPQQALLYRLSGDKNPLHADPAFAALGGFDRPILHGLCSFGIVCKAVVDHALGGEPDKVAAYGARFSGVLFPGETLSISMWTAPDAVLVSAECVERSSPVLTNGRIRLV
jgi:acyl dehydratase